MTKICAIDTETTSLRHDRRAWEIGIIAREPGQEDAEHHWFIGATDLDLGNADVRSLQVGRFYDRHPQYRPEREWEQWPDVESEASALRMVEAITRGAHLVGAVVSFDAEVLGARMRAHGICPSWHYHLIDVEALAAGHLNAQAAHFENRERVMAEAAEFRETARPPWKSDDLSLLLGIRVSDEDRHTALGDAAWALRVYDAVMGGPA